MKYLTTLLTTLISTLLPLSATSVDLASSPCPICKKQSHYLVLMSYSNYGEPSRDFMDSPIFSFSGPRICPWDLYVSQSSDWDIKNKKILNQTRTRLNSKKPAINLTPEESKFIPQLLASKHQDEIDELREIWWLRTFQGPGDTENEIFLTMKLYGQCWNEESPFPELREAYRKKLLTLFQKRIKEKDTPQKSRLRYRYLHAEFLRKGKQLDLALKEFTALDKQLTALTPEERQKNDPIPTWNKEQIILLFFKKADLKTLSQSIITPLPNPFRDDLDETKISEETWLKHKWALEELTLRCTKGDKPASDHLWKLINRDPKQLLAIAETIKSISLQELSKAASQWETWNKQLSKQLNSGKIPKSVKTKINQERNINILKSATGAPETNSWISNGKDENSPENRLRAAYKILDKGNDADAKMAATKILTELQSLDIKTAKDMFDYPLQYISSGFAKSPQKFRAELEQSLKKPWEEPFFKEIARLWLGKPDALANLEKTEALMTKPEYPGYGPAQMIYFYLETRKDPAWKQTCIRALKDLRMQNDRIFDYAQAIMDPEISKVVLARHKKLIQQINENPDLQWDWRTSEASEIENWWRKTQIRNLALQSIK